MRIRLIKAIWLTGVFVVLISGCKSTHRCRPFFCNHGQISNSKLDENCSSFEHYDVPGKKPKNPKPPPKKTQLDTTLNLNKSLQTELPCIQI